MEGVSSSTILRLRGLPYSATEDDVRQFFGEGSPPLAVYLGSKNGKNTGEAYVEYGTAAEAKKALQEKQHQHMGPRYIEIFNAAEAELVAATSGGGGGESPPRPSLAGPVVRLRGLPFNSAAADVLAFFEGVETVGGEPGVVFTCTPDGRPTGEAYVALAGDEALAAAMERHKAKIGSRYIEIFQASKGDLYQAVQQHGYFTTQGSRRRHHWHGAGGGGGGPPPGAYQPPDGGGMRPRAAQVDEMTNAFAGFGLSQRDMQVPGPPRWGAYGAPADQRYQQYMGPPRGMQPAAVLPGGAMSWRQGGGQMAAGGGGMHFNPAPGPPPGKGGRGGAPNGTRQGGGMMVHEYSHGHGGGGGQPMMFSPFMLQHPLMMQHSQQHHGSPWAAQGMMQQGGAWYGGMQMGRAPGMQMGGYTHFSPGYYQMRGGPGASQQMQGGGQYQGSQQYGDRRPQHQPMASAAGGASQPGVAAAAAAAAAATAPRSQHAPPQAPAEELAAQEGGSPAGSRGASPEAQPAAAAEEEAPPAGLATPDASPPTPEQ